MKFPPKNTGKPGGSPRRNSTSWRAQLPQNNLVSSIGSGGFGVPQRPFRANVAALVVDGDGFLLIAERSDFSGVWQIPQGGIDLNETAAVALLRELREEIGTDRVEVVGQLSGVFRYEFPAGRRDKHQGQEQTYFLVRLADRTLVQVDQGPGSEFSNVEWVLASEFIRRLRGFKSDVYRSAVEAAMIEYPGVLRT